MSNETAAAFYLVYLVSLHFLYVYIYRYFTILSDSISTGVVNGIAIPIQRRRAMLYHDFLIHVVVAVFVALLAGWLMVLVARTVSDDAFRSYGYMLALGLFATAISFLGFGVLNIRSLASTLPQAKAD